MNRGGSVKLGLQFFSIFYSLVNYYCGSVSAIIKLKVKTDSQHLVQKAETGSFESFISGVSVRPNANTLSIFVEVGCAVRTMKIPTCWHFGAHSAPYHGTDFP